MTDAQRFEKLKDFNVLSETIASFNMTPLQSLFEYLLWFVIWAPLIALLEYGTHRWIMHLANRLLDPKLQQLKSHGKHHKGANASEFIDVPLKNCLLLTSPAFLVLVVWGLAVGPWTAVLIPMAALLTWSFLYKYLWARMHRAIHDVESNWFQHCGPVFRFFRNHHLKHHANARLNYGTVFPWTDYLFFTWRDRKSAPAARPRPAGGHENAVQATECHSSDGHSPDGHSTDGHSTDGHSSGEATGVEGER